MTSFPIPEFIKEETRTRCKIVPYSDTMKSKFILISAELFHFLYEAPKLTFTLYVRVENVVIEFLRPEEFSLSLLDQVTAALHANKSVELFVLTKEKAYFDQLIDTVRSRKIEKLAERDPNLDRKVMKIFSDMSSTSQLIVRGGLTDEVINKVKQSAAYFVSNLKDNEEAVVTLSRMITHDPTLYDHSASVAIISGMIALQCVSKPLGRKDVETVTQCGLYHDVGKTCIPSAILNKPGKFTDDEFEVMKTHALLGEEELDRVIKAGGPIDHLVARVAGEHHERFTGKGYPRKRKGRLEDDPNGIHLFSRIVTIADVYSALLMKRVYKPAYEAQDAIKIMAEVAKDDYDPELFRNFLLSLVKSLNAYQEKLHGKDRGRILTMESDGHLREQKKLVI